MTSKTWKLGIMAILVSGAFVMTACEGECESCVSDPFAIQNAQGEWVAKPADNVITKADKAVNKAIYNIPTDKVCIETIGAGNTAKLLDEFAARCARFNGSVAQKDVATMGCYK